ncbi:hypothetical protein PanWU01x14_292490 [Parasponia andersonii]|uniref:Uncharacterized protein n=1 Tax=Parasponia andersonii TaxID=3476 RepID=A0A2P5AX43_PARAD|nr:hypothetical protein PanWU01x14_292490 [Parasponia andersonii]
MLLEQGGGARLEFHLDEGSQLLERILHQSSTCHELLMLDSPTVHVPLLLRKSLNSERDRRGGDGHLQRLSDA